MRFRQHWLLGFFLQRNLQSYCQDQSPGDLQSRQQIRKNCKRPFKWLLQNVIPQLGVPDIDSIAHGGVSHMEFRHKCKLFLRTHAGSDAILFGLQMFRQLKAAPFLLQVENRGLEGFCLDSRDLRNPGLVMCSDTTFQSQVRI